jgi:uncharacterized protein YdeI (BOF family)
MKKSATFFEIESNDNIVTAMSYEGKTISKLNKNDKDVYIFKAKSDKVNFDIDFKEHFKEIETHLKSKSGELLEKLEKLKA